MTFKLRINRRSAVPVHEQIVERVLRAIEAGELAAGHMLPSTRSVAGAEGINLMTVSRAYKALRARGVVTLVPGVGIQVANGANALDEPG
ncbi:MAG: GntR family transcriptional regulator, partial [Gammaproteobacteria bacterium HGW-Gammaproteobacteria-7]